MAIGKSGAINAALLAASILALSDPQLMARVKAYRDAQTAAVPEAPNE
jgi:5-(carboxyamino)imidazole ribonucleotide mutase